VLFELVVLLLVPESVLFDVFVEFVVPEVLFFVPDEVLVVPVTDDRGSESPVLQRAEYLELHD
jgi:hypothetical protein